MVSQKANFFYTETIKLYALRKRRIRFSGKMVVWSPPCLCCQIQVWAGESRTSLQAILAHPFVVTACGPILNKKNLLTQTLHLAGFWSLLRRVMGWTKEPQPSHRLLWDRGDIPVHTGSGAQQVWVGGSAKSPRPSERQHVSGWGPELSLDWRRVSWEVIGAGEREGEGGEREREQEKERRRRKDAKVYLIGLWPSQRLY